MADKNPLQVAYGALSAISAATVVQLAAAGAIDLPSRVGIGCFAVAIPLLAVLFVAPVPHDEPPTKYTPTQRIYATVTTIALGLCIVGLTAVFWHFGWLFGLLFGASCILAWRALRRWSTAQDFFDEPR
jgi:hypothetical protein